MVADSQVAYPKQQIRGRAVASEKDRHSTSTPKDQRSATPLSRKYTWLLFPQEKVPEHPSRLCQPHSLLPPVLGLRSYQITDHRHNYEEKDLEAAITPITMTLPPGSLCLCPNVRQHPRLGLL